MNWSSIPPRYKKAGVVGILLWLVIMAGGSGWISLHAGETLKIWQSKIPQAIAQLKTIYLAPTGEDGAPLKDVFISLVMTDLGLATTPTQRAIDELPGQVALAFSPYSAEIAEWVKKADEKGHQSLILLPMEPSTYPKDDPGPMALLTRISEKENTAHLNRVLSQAPEAVGVMNFMGSLFLTDQTLVTPLFLKLQEKGKFFITTPGIPPTYVGPMAENIGLPYLGATMDIDLNASEQSIQERLLSLEKIAREKGHAVGIIRPYPITVSAVKQWAGNADQRNIKLVPVTTILGIEENKSDEKAPEQPTATPG